MRPFCRKRRHSVWNANIPQETQLSVPHCVLPGHDSGERARFATRCDGHRATNEKSLCSCGHNRLWRWDKSLALSNLKDLSATFHSRAFTQTPRKGHNVEYYLISHRREWLQPIDPKDLSGITYARSGTPLISEGRSKTATLILTVLA
jgi:hypothetical protein